MAITSARIAPAAGSLQTRQSSVNRAGISTTNGICKRIGASHVTTPSSSSPTPSHRYGRVRSVLCKAEEKAFGGNWLPGSTPPPYLDGSLPGDVGFDPLGLGEDPEALKWYDMKWFMARCNCILPLYLVQNYPFFWISSMLTLDYFA